MSGFGFRLFARFVERCTSFTAEIASPKGGQLGAHPVQGREHGGVIYRLSTDRGTFNFIHTRLRRWNRRHQLPVVGRVALVGSALAFAVADRLT
jgi:hypothetical protein